VRLAILFLILIFLIDMLGFYLGHFRPYYYDTILHFGGGFFVALFFAAFFKNYGITEKSFGKDKFLIFALVILSATMLVGAFWEFSEYLATAYFSDYLAEKYGIICCIGNLDDTIGDLALDIFGAIIFILLHDISYIKVNLSAYKKS